MQSNKEVGWWPLPLLYARKYSEFGWLVTITVSVLSGLFPLEGYTCTDEWQSYCILIIIHLSILSPTTPLPGVRGGYNLILTLKFAPTQRG